MNAEQLTDAVAYHGEGPIWDERVGQVAWVDMLRGDVLFTTPGGATDRRNIGAVAGCVVPRASGGYAVTTERAFGFLDEELTMLPELWDDVSVRMNDGACDPKGRFYCGSMAYDFATGRGKLYRLDTDGTVDTIFDGVTISNGLGWSPDATKAYYIDTPTRRVDVCDPDLTTRRPFVEISSDAGSPDGLTVDAEGGVWVALWGGSAVHRYSPDGELDAVVPVAARQVTSCAFGGDDRATLFISTSAENLADPEPGAGALFTVQPGVRGLPTLTYGG
jgi:sugar lactone lactonase YvrE